MIRICRPRKPKPRLVIHWRYEGRLACSSHVLRAYRLGYHCRIQSLC